MTPYATMRAMKVLHVLETSIPHIAGYTIRASAIIENQRKLGLEVVVAPIPVLRAISSCWQGHMRLRLR